MLHTIDKGNFDCTSGLSKLLLDTLTGAAPYNVDGNATRQGFSNPLSLAQLEMLKAMAWAQAQAVADQIAAQQGAFFMARQSVATTLTSGAYSKIIFNAEIWDSHGSYNPANGNFQVQAGQAGTYLFFAMLLPNTGGYNLITRTQFFHNGDPGVGSGWGGNASDGYVQYHNLPAFMIIPALQTGDTVCCAFYHNAPVALTMQGDGNYNYFMGIRIA